MEASTASGPSTAAAYHLRFHAPHAHLARELIARMVKEN